MKGGGGGEGGEILHFTVEYVRPRRCSRGIVE